MKKQEPASKRPDVGEYLKTRNNEATIVTSREKYQSTRVLN